MTTETSGTVKKNFVTVTLPWLLGAGALLIYLTTLHHWISFLSLPAIARICGWSWQPEFGRPLAVAVLFPFRWLSGAWMPLVVNLFTAVCAALVLALLARSVALLPHDLTHNDPLRKKTVSILSTPTAWMPPVLAAVICGLQLSFWEHATSATGEIIGLLVFAYAIRCLLEFRIDQNQSWLSRCAFVYAAGMANDWVMAAYFPVFFAAIVWLKGFGPFWNRPFLLRMALWALAGFSLYLMLPIVLSLSFDHVNFWMALKINLKSQAIALLRLRSPAFAVLLMTSLLPLVILSIPWRPHTVQYGDDTRLGIFFTKITSHFMHVLFFVLSLWIMLDPFFTPRSLPVGTSMLHYYYISALVSGYCTGYFLLFRAGRPKTRPAKLPVAVTCVLLCILPLAQLWKNLAQVRATNGPAIREFVRALYEDLPEGKSAVLSEDSNYLLLLRAELEAHGRSKDAILLDTPSLVWPEYHELMAALYKTRWPAELLTNKVDAIGPEKLVELVSRFAAREPVVYLHPSSGLFFELFMDEPNGTIHRLTPRPDKNVAGHVLPDSLTATNELVWQQRWMNNLRTLAARTEKISQHTVQPSRSPLHWLQLKVEHNLADSTLGAAYSKQLDYWGVQMQRAGRWDEAATWFQRAIELNPDNLAARINLEYNQRHRQGDNRRLTVAWVQNEFPGLLAKYDDWWRALSDNGPVDEPTYLFRTGLILLTTSNPRQAVEAFVRCTELAPGWLLPKLWLAQGLNSLRDFADALQQTDDVQNSSQTLKGAGLAQLLHCRVVAMRGLERTNDAAVCVEEFISKYGEHKEVLVTAANLCAHAGQFGRELEILHKLLSLEPDNSELLTRKGLAELRLARFPEAIATLTMALSRSPSDDKARLLRAVAALRAGQLDAARRDYLELLKKPDKSQNALFALGGIAWQEHHTNAIIEYYQQYLSNAVPNSPRFTVAFERLNQLKDE